ncbi:MAG TPA: gliding motility-associated C-terminal domain-containing protein, partial [Chitinophagales bacterium]|nr:gliding motility-associated C-terminal domain-containing protein [Chitinophagales bacterium]
IVFSLGNDTVLCDGESFYLQLNITGAAFLWHDGTTANDITITENEVVSVEVFQSPCPGVTDSVVVTFTPLPPLELGNDTSICVFDSLSFNVSSPGAAFVWHDGSTDAFHDVTGSGWYSVTATAGGCAASDSAYAAVMDTPVATLGSDTTLCNGRGLVLGPLLPAGAFEWNDNSTDSIKEVSGTGLYMVTVTTACGSDADTIDVRFAECSCEVFVPNLFTPNNDGVNDRLKSYFACPVSDYRWTLFDRWGERVFESTNPEETWDGFFRGRAASPGVYAWILSFTEQRAILEPHRQILEGNTTLLR